MGDEMVCERLPFAIVVLALSAALQTTAAFADTDWGNLSAGAIFTTDYRFRGLSNSDREPAFQPTVNWSGPDGFYVGAWGSNVDFKDRQNTSIELDLYGGKHFDLDGSDLNIEAYYYSYPNHDRPLGGANYSYFETIAQLSHSFDKLTLMGTLAVSPDYFADTGEEWYVAGSASYALNDWVTISANLGHDSVAELNGSDEGYGYPYLHWDIGATATWNGFSLDLRYVDTNIPTVECGAYEGTAGAHWCGSTVLLSLGYTLGN
jgi:uncharacterized protein (TIGR02001 family)